MNIPVQVVEVLVGWIDQNLHKPLRIDEIARHAGYSKWHLQRLFSRHTGESLGQYVRKRRLQMAAQELLDTNDRILDISMKYGFDSQQTFTRTFSKTFHQTPGAYRKYGHAEATGQHI